MQVKYESEIDRVNHQTTRDLFDLGVIDAARMREFDEMCLAKVMPAMQKPAALKRTKPASRGGCAMAVPA
jgi:DNA-binding transcriptional regulator YiaG